MPKFEVKLLQMVEEIAYVYVEAATAEEAMEIVDQAVEDNYVPDWQDGSEIVFEGCIRALPVRDDTELTDLD